MRKKSALVRVWVISLFVPLSLFAFVSARSRQQTGVTFSKDVAPILRRHCVECHRPGDIAPMSLVTYEEVKPYASLIAEKVEARQMPPWHADSHYGEFANERKLSPAEIRTLAAWVEGGSMEGERRDLPPAPPSFTGRWKIGAPDRVFEIAPAHTLGREVADTYVYFRIPTEFAEDKWVQAVEFRPGNRRVVHHAVAFIETPEQFAAGGAAAGPSVQSMWSLLDSAPTALEVMEGTTRRVKPGVRVVNDGCGETDVEAVSTSSNNAVLSVYAPGRGVDVWPAGTAKKIPARSNIILQMHYSKPPGETASDATSVALVFAKTPVEKMVLSRGVNNVLFEIPAGADNHRVTACWDVQRDIEVLALMPHLHVRGKSMRFELIRRDGRRETLLFVPAYDFHWQTLYSLKRPLTIPGDSRLMVTAFFDNSDKNMHNPDPAKVVRHGSATVDEMMIGFVDYVVPRPGGRGDGARPIDFAAWDAFVGRYEYAPARVVQSIVREGERLYAEAAGRRLELHPTSGSTFSTAEGEAEITFTKDGTGAVTGFVITQNEKLLRFVRKRD